MNQATVNTVKSQTGTAVKKLNLKKSGYLLFQVGNEFYGIEGKKVVEVLDNEQIINIPFMPEYIIGIINYRENIVPIMDLRRKFNFRKSNIISSYNYIAIVSIDNFQIGLILDSITEYQEKEHDNFFMTPSNDSQKKNFSGFIKMGEHMGILLDVEKIVLQQKSELEILKNSILWSMK
jgi:purine-binding chemotaxis protein CheW